MDNVIDLTEDEDLDAGSNAIPVVSDDEDDEELKLAIALSLQDQIPVGLPVKSPAEQLVSKSTELEFSARPQTSLLGLDRKAMEMERLARLKRKRDGGENPESDPPRPTVRRKPSPTPPPNPTSKPPATNKAFSSIISFSKPTPQPQTSIPPRFSFLEGKVLLTATPSRHSATGSLEAISFSDIIKPPPPSKSSAPYILKSALLSSFNTDFDWVFPHFNSNGGNLASTKFVLVLHAQDARHRQLLQSDFDGLKSIRLVMPEIPAGGFGTMHSKLMLLFFAADEGRDEICRVVVPSANLVPHDWGVGGVLENVLYVIDLPLKTEQGAKDTQFETQLLHQLNAMGVPADVLRKVSKFYFTATERDMLAGFVYTIAGSRILSPLPGSLATKQGSVSGTGLLSLSETVASLGLSIPSTSPAYPPRLDFVTSSLGNLSIVFVWRLFQAVCGSLDPITAATAATTRRGGVKKIGSDAQEIDDLIRSNLRIYFPSAKTVKNSKGGEVSAGTICFQKKWWQENDLIRHCMRDCIGIRGDGILMHSKILYVSFKQPMPIKTTDDKTRLCSGWAYIGSANLSESAWGKVTNDAKLKVPKTTSRNWESGVIIPVFADVVNLPSRNSSDLPPGSFGSGKQKANAQLGGVTSSTSDISSAVSRAGSRSNIVTDSRDENSLDGPSMSDKTGEIGLAKLDCIGESTQVVGMGGCKDIRIKNGAKSRHMQQVNTGLNEERLGMSDTFIGTIPIPMQIRASNLVAEESEPWFFKE